MESFGEKVFKEIFRYDINHDLEKEGMINVGNGIVMTPDMWFSEMQDFALNNIDALNSILLFAARINNDPLILKDDKCDCSEQSEECILLKVKMILNLLYSSVLSSKNNSQRKKISLKAMRLLRDGSKEKILEFINELKDINI